MCDSKRPAEGGEEGKIPAFGLFLIQCFLLVLTKLCLPFQRASLNITDIGPMVTSTRCALLSMKEKRGLWEKRIINQPNEETSAISLQTPGESDP